MVLPTANPPGMPFDETPPMHSFLDFSKSCPASVRGRPTSCRTLWNENIGGVSSK